MALLTDPSGLKGKPFKILVKRHKLVCFLLYVMSIIWFLCLASDQINSATYLSENALLPGLVVVGSDLQKDAKAILREMEDYVLDGESIPEDWLREKFTLAFVESFVHNFTLSGSFGTYSGKNIYGIIRGGGASNEAIVLSVPYRSRNNPAETTAPGLAVMLAITQYFRKQKYWAKDIIMLVTEHEQVGMQAWLEAYHGVSCGTGVLQSGELEARGGAIQAAINLELHSDFIKYVDVKVSGLNGQLPNLDLVNLVLRICSKERVRHTFANKEKIHNLPSYEQWQHSLEIMTSMLLAQAPGVPDGNHGLFHRFGIESVTMEGHASNGNGPYVTLHHVGRVIEGLFRSINNLLERFHQSYFFYIMTDTDRFASIGLYMPCNGMLIAALFIRAFSLYVDMRLEREDASQDVDPNIAGTCTMFLIAHAIGFMADAGSNIVSVLTFANSRIRTMAVYSVLSAFSFIIPLLVFPRFKGKDWSMLHILSLVYLGTLLMCVGMSNFSFAYLTGLVITPISLLLYPASKRHWKFILWILIHPLVLLLIVVSSVKLYRGFDTVSIVEALANSLLLASLDYQIYGSGMLRMVCVAYLSVWVTFAPPPKDRHNIMKKKIN
ncbi:unnamed protein product [Nezara viridula]|uniref:Uncharacterized protein n=1 Tax=Nezara viridula TaxID=85310 RepID=A0A9P0E9J9_NEZVI|nr:unnamed protein product [Nezara viridula]